MNRVRWSRFRPSPSSAAAVGLAFLALMLAGCGSSTPSSPASSTALPPSAAVGYWRSPANMQPYSWLVYIRQLDGRYYLWLLPSSARAPLVVQGDRLARHHYQQGHEIEREVFWAQPDGTLALVDYLPNEGGGFTATPTVVFTKAAGSAAQLATELRGRFAEPTLDKQVGILMGAVIDWARQHGSLPPRAALLPGGAFWKWRGAPHLTNAIMGGPLVLGSGPGDFDYTGSGSLSGGFSCSISLHRGYGLPDDTQSESGS